MGTGATAYSRTLIQGLPDALPNFSIKLPKPHETLSLAIPALDWEYLEKPLHINCKARVAALQTDWALTHATLFRRCLSTRLKSSSSGNHWPTPMCMVCSQPHSQSCPIPKPRGCWVPPHAFIPHQTHTRMEWMRHPLADVWFFEVTDTCAFGGLWDGNGGGLKGWAAAHLAMQQTRTTIWNHLRCVYQHSILLLHDHLVVHRHHKVKSSVDAAKALEAALMASHDQIIKVQTARGAFDHILAYQHAHQPRITHRWTMPRAPQPCSFSWSIWTKHVAAWCMRLWGMWSSTVTVTSRAVGCR